MEKNKPQILSIFGFKYIRLILEKINPEEIEKLKRKFSYIHIYSYGKPNLKNFNVREQTISIINLKQNLDAIFKKFKKNTRNEIRKIEKIKNLKFKILNNNLNKSYKFYKKIKQKDKTRPDIKKEFKDCIFFNAYLNNILIVSMSCYDTGNILRLKHVASKRKEKDFDSRITGYASRRIIWEICKYGHKNNYDKLDLAGVNFTDSAKKGVAEFKQSFGGKIDTCYICRHEAKTFRFIKKILNLFKRNIN